MFAAGAGHNLQAARLLGAYEAAEISVTGWPLEAFGLAPSLASFQARLEQEPYTAARSAGRLLSVDQALDEALAGAEFATAVPSMFSAL
jgi:hypothetical protein